MLHEMPPYNAKPRFVLGDADNHQIQQILQKKIKSRIHCVKPTKRPNTQLSLQPKNGQLVFAFVSGALEWCPHGAQVERFEAVGGLRPVHDDILIAKLRPGQEIVAEVQYYSTIGNNI